MSDSAIPWTTALQAPLSMGFSRQEYWSGLPCSPGYLLNTGIKPRSPSFTIWAPREEYSAWPNSENQDKELLSMSVPFSSFWNRNVYNYYHMPIPPLHLESRSPVDVLFLWFTDAEEFYPRVLTCCWFRWSGWDLGLLNWWCLDASLNFKFETLGNVRVGRIYFAHRTDINLDIQKADCSGLKFTSKKICPYLNHQNFWMLPSLEKGSYRRN